MIIQGWADLSLALTRIKEKGAVEGKGVYGKSP